jgi:DNA repair protein RecN (Recombination protein N)
MLALAGQGARGGAATFVFDEIDAGVGGRNAAALGERLRALSAYHQVLCVTHLPQVAAQADAHLVVG